MHHPYTDVTLDSNYGEGRNGMKKRTDSEEAFEKWNYVFKVQKSRWEEEFTDIKQKFLKKVDTEKPSAASEILGEDSKTMAQYKRFKNQKDSYTIPDMYLPRQIQSLPKGQDGLQEQLKRDKIIVQKLRK